MRLIDADALKSVFNYLCEQKNVGTITLEAVEAIIDTAPTVNQWIPCSERLPELKKWVLVSSGDCVVSDCLVVSGDNKIWYECGTIDIENDAWMPLPEPYKEA